MTFIQFMIFILLSMTHVMSYDYNYANNYGNSYGNYYRDYGNYNRMRMRRDDYISAPVIKSLSAIDPAGFQVEWTRVDSYDEVEPVIGYKIKLWEVYDKKVLKYDRFDSVVMLVESENRFPQPLDPMRPPDTEPVVIILPGCDRTKTRVSNIKLNVLYEVRVLAFTRSTDGPLSQPTRIKLIKDNESDRHKEVYMAS